MARQGLTPLILHEQHWGSFDKNEVTVSGRRFIACCTRPVFVGIRCVAKCVGWGRDTISNGQVWPSSFFYCLLCPSSVILLSFVCSNYRIAMSWDCNRIKLLNQALGSVAKG